MTKLEKAVAFVTLVGGVFGIAWAVFTYVKPPESPPAPEVRRDPEIDARALRTAANSLRAIASNHVGAPAPASFQKAEAAYKSATDAFNRREYTKARDEFDMAYRLYEDTYNDALSAGH